MVEPGDRRSLTFKGMYWMDVRKALIARDGSEELEWELVSDAEDEWVMLALEPPLPALPVREPQPAIANVAAYQSWPGPSPFPMMSPSGATSSSGATGSSQMPVGGADPSLPTEDDVALREV